MVKTLQFLVNLMIILTSKNDSVTLEDLEFVHFSLSQLDNGVVVLRRVLDLQLVRGLLPLEDSGGVVFLVCRFDHLGVFLSFNFICYNLSSRLNQESKS